MLLYFCIGERRLLDLNQCLTANEFAVKMDADDMFSPTRYGHYCYFSLDFYRRRYDHLQGQQKEALDTIQ